MASYSGVNCQETGISFENNLIYHASSLLNFFSYQMYKLFINCVIINMCMKNIKMPKISSKKLVY